MVIIAHLQKKINPFEIIKIKSGVLIMRNRRVFLIAKLMFFMTSIVVQRALLISIVLCQNEKMRQKQFSLGNLTR